MENIPTLIELRSREYCVRTNRVDDVTHSSKWENGGLNRQHTLRVSLDFIKTFNTKGPRGRWSSRVPGNTPDESYVKRGRRASGYPHQLRRKMCLLISASDEYIQKMLERNFEYKPSKKKAIGIVMPDLEKAIDELYRKMIKINPELRHHPAFRKRWAPAICRLIEIHSIDQDKQSQLSGAESIIDKRTDNDPSEPSSEDEAKTTEQVQKLSAESVMNESSVDGMSKSSSQLYHRINKDSPHKFPTSKEVDSDSS